MISKKKLMKQKRSLIIILLGTMVVGAFLLTPASLMAIDSAVMKFMSGDDVAAEGAIVATMTAYNDDGIVKTQMFQSGFILDKVEITYIMFEVDIVFSGSYVDWNTLDIDISIQANPYEKDTIQLVDKNDITINELTEVDDTYKYHIGVKLGGDDNSLLELVGNWLPGDEMSTLKHCLMDIFARIDVSVLDFKGQLVQAGVTITAIWELEYEFDDTEPDSNNDGKSTDGDGRTLDVTTDGEKDAA